MVWSIATHGQGGKKSGKKRPVVCKRRPSRICLCLIIFGCLLKSYIFVRCLKKRARIQCSMNGLPLQTLFFPLPAIVLSIDDLFNNNLTIYSFCLTDVERSLML